MDNREQTILKILTSERTVAIETLASRLFVSPSTVRRCVADMEKRGLLLRSHGKVVALPVSADANVGISERVGSMRRTKSALCTAAAGELDGAKVVFLDASTTVYELVPHIKKLDGVIALTTGLLTAKALADADVKLIVSGGNCVNESYSLTGAAANDTIKKYNADVCFVSAHGLSEDGYATDTSARENETRLALLSQSKRKILLVDSSKVGKKFYHNLCHISYFNAVYSDAVLPTAVMDKVQKFVLVEVDNNENQ